MEMSQEKFYKKSGIKQERMQYLKGKYQSPELELFLVKEEFQDDDSGMAQFTSCPCYMAYGCYMTHGT